ncbi:uncharacterized protein YukE [Clostridium acetobutylicum]|uniref:Uncharacterized protein n=1 Tax=Clostridium acetobutylicum (strain ATCC 824 / DSM 792 / JCM 1419 / IAM 19013 / LMG 5710 / NBRC 13948 / NRRL B-527 / VKM B-1787 / 2291 / W) TaxID=272562 RepID=Q97KJ2_CLOAB|nr:MULTISPECIES: hypothetical protein [Clostridium]AAK78903.1 Hypothetical protein, CF-2 family [Clostridium acetobutylicum ATCC 824]ADZ19978.1 conserved hypothetical protein [Clostridium acetobutylicum EA 2018]AEI31508.1 hypothetical protein SMB_G0944 [Clostridium acetobutylicum DSM 1731]AWV80622.1 hypothetical protein DK921_11035 [Clostridium acetobutylicum]MBC2392812.1 hypothetical protein [Clostridium acetobutylicum]
MNSDEIRIDEKACDDVIKDLKAVGEKVKETYNLIHLSNRHIEDGIKGSAVDSITTEYNKIVKMVKEMQDNMGNDVAAVNNIVSSFDAEDKMIKTKFYR